MKKIKLFVTCHKQFVIPPCKLLYPTLAGADFNKHVEGYYNDNDGENISFKNKKYCELTVQYYAWKNHDADYYGFMHYRRYFLFAKDIKESEIFIDNFNNFVETYDYNEQTLQDVITKYDLIIPKRNWFGTNMLQYASVRTQDLKDLTFCTNYIIKKYPKMKSAVRKYMISLRGYSCNMFVMKKELFNDYCAWLFDILEQHEKFNSHANSDVQTYRVSGYLAERLLGIYITYLKQNKKLKIKELSKILIKNPAEQVAIKPEESCNKTIAIPFNNETLPSASVLLQSLVNTNKNAEILLLHTEMDKEIIDNLKNQGKNTSNAIKDITISNQIKNYTQLLTSLPKLLNGYENVIVVKPNCLCLKELNMVQTDKCMCGTLDVDLVVKNCKKRPQFTKLRSYGINFSNAISENYLQLNLKNFEQNINKLKKYNKFLDILSANREDIYVLPQKTIFKADNNFKSKNIYTYAPYYLYEEYMSAKKDPDLVCFDGHSTLPTDKATNFSSQYFELARTTPYYELFFKIKETK